MKRPARCRGWRWCLEGLVLTTTDLLLIIISITIKSRVNNVCLPRNYNIHVLND